MGKGCHQWGGAHWRCTLELRKGIQMGRLYRKGPMSEVGGGRQTWDLSRDSHQASKIATCKHIHVLRDASSTMDGTRCVSAMHPGASCSIRQGKHRAWDGSCYDETADYKEARLREGTWHDRERDQPRPGVGRGVHRRKEADGALGPRKGGARPWNYHGPRGGGVQDVQLGERWP